MIVVMAPVIAGFSAGSSLAAMVLTLGAVCVYLRCCAAKDRTAGTLINPAQKYFTEMHDSCER